MSVAGFVRMIGNLPLVGNALRGLARHYEDGSVVTIRTGLAKGLRWRRRHRYVNGCWIGHYELHIQHALQREAKQGGTFYDVGANAGFFTLVAARVVGQTGKCVAFDPSPDNVASIREQLDLNGLNARCTAVQQAVGGFEGRAQFSFDAPGSPKGHLGASASNESTTQVEVTTLDAAASRFGQPTFVKVDVEGAEVEVLRGASAVIAAGTTWLIELHNDACEAGTSQILSAAGYTFFGIDGTAIPPNEPLGAHVIARPPAR